MKKMMLAQTDESKLVSELKFKISVRKTTISIECLLCVCLATQY